MRMIDLLPKNIYEVLAAGIIAVLLYGLLVISMAMWG